MWFYFILRPFCYLSLILLIRVELQYRNSYIFYYTQDSMPWRRERHRYYAAIGGIVVVVSLELLAVWRKNIVSSLSQMVGAFILISAATNLFDSKRKITSSSVNELSLIILRRSNLGVCNSSIFLGRVNSMRLGLTFPLKSLLLWCY